MRALSFMMVLLLLSLCAFPLVQADTCPLENQPWFLQDDESKADRYEVLEHPDNHTCINTSQAGGAIQLARVPRLNPVAEAAPFINLTHIYKSPVDDVYYITAIGADGIDAPLYIWDGHTLEFLDIAFPDPVTAFAIHPDGEYALVAYGDHVVTLDLETLVTEEPRMVRNALGYQAEYLNGVNSLTWHPDGHTCYIGQAERCLAYYYAPDDAIYTLDDQHSHLTRTLVVDSVWSQLQDIDDMEEGWNQEFEPTDIDTPAEALDAYYHGIDISQESSIWGKLAACGVGALAGATLICGGFATLVLSPSGGAAIFLLAATLTVTGELLVCAELLAFNEDEFNNFVQYTNAPINNIVSLSDDELLLVGSDYVSIMNMTEPDYDSGTIQETDMDTEDWYSEEVFTHCLEGNDRTDGLQYMYTNVIKDGNVVYLFGNELVSWSDDDATCRPFYRTFDLLEDDRMEALGPVRPLTFKGIGGAGAIYRAMEFDGGIKLICLGADGEDIITFIADFVPGQSVYPMRQLDVSTIGIVSDLLELPRTDPQDPAYALAVVGNSLCIYSEDAYYRLGIASSKVIDTGDRNIGVVSLDWTQSTPAGCSVVAQVTVNNGLDWYNVTSGTDVVVLADNENYPTTALYAAADLTDFQYRFNMVGTGQATPSIYAVSWKLQRLDVPVFSMSAETQDWDQDYNNVCDSTRVKFSLNYDGASSTVDRMDVRFDLHFEDGESTDALNNFSSDGVCYVEHLYTRAGTYRPWCLAYYTITVDGIDYQLYSNETLGGALVIENQLPQPRITLNGLDFNTIVIKKGVPITVSAALSYDPDGNIVNYEWSNYDGLGSVDSGSMTDTRALSCNWVSAASDGSEFTVRLTVMDDNDGTAFTEISVKAYFDNAPPMVAAAITAGGASFNQDGAGLYRLEAEYQYTITSSSTDPVDGDSIERLWVMVKDSENMDVTEDFFTTNVTNGNFFRFTPDFEQLGQYSFYMMARDDSGMSHDTSPWEYVFSAKIQPFPLSGDWTILQNITLEGWAITLGGSMNVDNSSVATFTGCSVLFTTGTDGIQVSSASTLILIGGTVDAGYTTGTNLQGQVASEHPDYWWCSVYGNLTAMGTRFSHTGAGLDSYGIRASGITYNRAMVGGRDIWIQGKGSLTECSVDASLYHGISTRSMYRVPVSRCIIQNTGDFSARGISMLPYTDSAQIYASTTSNLLLTSCTVRNGGFDSDGLGLYAQDATISMASCIFEDNTEFDIYAVSSTMNIQATSLSYSYEGAYLDGCDVSFKENSIVNIRKDTNGNLRLVSCAGTFRNITLEGAETCILAGGVVSYNFEGLGFSDFTSKVNAATRAYIWNYVKLKVVDLGIPVEGAGVLVRSAGSDLYDNETDTNGETPWLLLLDRDYVGTVYTGRNVSAEVSAYGYKDTSQVDVTETGRVILYQVRRAPGETPSDGGSTGIGKSGSGFFDLTGSAWLVLVGIVLLGVGLASWLYTTGKTSQATYAILGTVGAAMLALFVMNGWTLAAIGTGVFLGVVGYFALKSAGIDLMSYFGRGSRSFRPSRR